MALEGQNLKDEEQKLLNEMQILYDSASDKSDARYDNPPRLRDVGLKILSKRAEIKACEEAKEQALRAKISATEAEIDRLTSCPFDELLNTDHVDVGKLERLVKLAESRKRSMSELEALKSEISVKRPRKL